MKERIIQAGIAVGVTGTMFLLLWLAPQRDPKPQPVPIPPVPVPTKERPLVLPTDVQVSSGGEKIEALLFEGAKVTWIVPPSTKEGISVFPYSDHAIVVPRAEGEFDLGAVAVFAGQVRGPLWVKVRSGKGPLPPPPGPEPDPKPDPKPPGPSPLPTDAFRAIIIEETEARTKLPEKQIQILFDKRIRDYLDAKCTPRPDGKGKSWLITDQHTDVSAYGPAMAAAMARPRTSLPWIVIGGTKGGYEGPLPGTVDETLSLLKKWGGE